MAAVAGAPRLSHHDLFTTAVTSDMALPRNRQVCTFVVAPSTVAAVTEASAPQLQQHMLQPSLVTGIGIDSASFRGRKSDACITGGQRCKCRHRCGGADAGSSYYIGTRAWHARVPVTAAVPLVGRAGLLATAAKGDCVHMESIHVALSPGNSYRLSGQPLSRFHQVTLLQL